MTKQEEETALLHQQASTKYLQGEFEQALEVWRRLLELDPQDERAQEGVRLCEMLAEDAEEAPAAGSPPSPDGGIDELEDLLGPDPAQAIPAPGPSPDAAVENEPLESEIQFEFTDLPAESDLPDPNRQSEGIDAGDIGEMATVGLAAAAPQPPAVPAGDAVADPVGIDFGEIDAKLGAATAAPPAPAVEPAAASELAIRVRALHAEALEAHQAGNPAEAMAVLSRLFILDENDAAARELEQIVRGQMTPPEAAPAAAPAIDESAMEPDLDEGTEEIGLDFDAVVRGASGNNVLDELDEAAAQTPQAAVRPARTVPTAASAKRSQPALTKVLIIATVVIGLAAAGFYVVPKFLGGGPAQPAEPSPAKTATKKPAASDAPASDPGTAADSADTVAATPPPMPVDELLVQGQQAMDEARYADAVLAYKQILDADPGHEQARQLLLRSGDRYREQQEELKKWEDAFAHFNGGRYQEALKAFYRLPEDVEAERLDRYKRNGWYNMGRQSLRSGSCTQARSHFKEARAIDPDDEEVLQALELCNTCLHPDKAQSYYDAVTNLRERGLED